MQEHTDELCHLLVELFRASLNGKAPRSQFVTQAIWYKLEDNPDDIPIMLSGVGFDEESITQLLSQAELYEP